MLKALNNKASLNKEIGPQIHDKTKIGPNNGRNIRLRMVVTSQQGLFIHILGIEELDHNGFNGKLHTIARSHHSCQPPTPLETMEQTLN